MKANNGYKIRKVKELIGFTKDYIGWKTRNVPTCL